MRQVGYLPELYEDAPSEKYKKTGSLFRRYDTRHTHINRHDVDTVRSVMELFLQPEVKRN